MEWYTRDITGLLLENSSSQKSCSALYRRRDVKYTSLSSTDFKQTEEIGQIFVGILYSRFRENPSSRSTEKCNRPSEHRGGTNWSSCLEHCITTRKAAGSIPDGVLHTALWAWGRHFLEQKSVPGIFPVGRSGETRPLSGADNFTTFMTDFFRNLAASTSCNPPFLACSRHVQGMLYLYLLYNANMPIKIGFIFMLCVR